MCSMPVIPPQIRARAEYLKGLANSAQEEAIMYQNALGVSPSPISPVSLP